MRIFVSGVLASAVLFSGLLAGVPVAEAGVSLKIDETRSFNVGVGLRTSLNFKDKSAPNGTDWSKEASLDSIRLYTSGQVHEYIKLEFNTERSGENIRVLDGIAKIELTDIFNVWAGRFLPPSDRSNLSGPYYLNSWAFPFVQNYPAIFAGRDEGLAVWGQTGKGQFKYQVGAFNGRHGQNTSNVSDSPLLAARLTYNFWDPEPGYYNSSTYYGAKDVLAVGLVFMNQNDGAGTRTTRGDFNGWSIDALLEKKLSNGGVIDLEGAYYDYHLDKVADASLIQGDGYFVMGSYLFPAKTGFGKLQPQVRYQRFDRDKTNAAGSIGTRERLDAGVSYIIDGHNARFTVLYANDEDKGAGTNASSVTMGLQLQL